MEIFIILKKLERNVFKNNLKHEMDRKIQLFLYLKSKLSGEALADISNLAWEILDRRYLLESTIQMVGDDEFSLNSGMTVNTYQTLRLRANIKQPHSTLDDVLMELVLPRIVRSRCDDLIEIPPDPPAFSYMMKKLFASTMSDHNKLTLEKNLRVRKHQKLS